MIKRRRINYDRGAFWLGIASLMAALCLGYLTVQSDWRIADESGAFRRPEVVLGLAGLPLDQSKDTSIIFGAPRISGGSDVVVAALPLSVSNSGDRTLDNTTLTFRFHDLFRREVLENLSFVPVGSVQATKIQRSFSKSGSLQYSSYLLSEINPGETIMVNEPLYLHATSFSVPVDARTADDIPVRFSANVEVALEFEVSLAARDLFSRDYRLSLETAEATSLDDLSERVATRRVRTRMADARAKATFGQYLRALAFGIDEDRIFVVFSELEEHAAGDGRLWFARPEPRVRQVSYKPVAWSLLFQ